MPEQKLQDKIKALESELRHWKANHADVVSKYHKLREKYGEALLMIRTLERQLEK